ncbi:MAG: helix-turn-helix transcriptional regulator [Thermonemataceae bacterium]|nr:helix-turn-helix transcriptional regulator [Thermonemataceae bacterium]
MENKETIENIPPTENIELVERLKIIIDLKETQISKFADEIGVQRSNMSHIIAGRNKPSLDFLQKIIQRYPDVNTNWLLNGIGSPLLEEKKNEEKHIFEEDLENKMAESLAKKNKAKEKEIERVVVFYTDKTFETFENRIKQGL